MPIDALLQVLLHPVVQAILIAVVILTLLSLLSSFLRKRQRWMINSYDISLPGAGEADLAEIKQVRLELWQEWSETRQLDRKQWMQMIRRIVACVATHFHPDARNPEEKVNLGQVLHHIGGLNLRLAHLLNHPRLGAFRDLSIDQIDTWYRRINSLYSNTFFRRITSRHVRRVFEFFFLIVSTINPFTYGRKITSTIGLELGTRYFFSAFFAILAEESWKMFSGESENDAAESPECEALLSIARAMKGLSAREYAFLAGRIVSADQSNEECFAQLRKLEKGNDNGKSLEKLRKKGIGTISNEVLKQFGKLPSGDEITKLASIRSLRSRGESK